MGDIALTIRGDGAFLVTSPPSKCVSQDSNLYPHPYGYQATYHLSSSLLVPYLS